MAGVLRLLTPGELPPAGVERFRVALTGPAIAILTVGIWLAACCWVWWMGGLEKVKIPSALCGWAVFWIGLYWLYLINELCKAMRDDAWVAALGPDGVYVNLRSYRNLALDAPRTHVVLVPYAVIAQARGEPHAAGEEIGDGSSRYVELKLAKGDTDALEAKLEEEQNGPPGASPLARMLWKSSPVVIADRAVRIGWRANPSASVFLDRLARRGVTVAQPWAHIMMRAS
jgi:hypothetical protein